MASHVISDLRLRTNQNAVFVTSKSKIAPVNKKSKSIPWLELKSTLIALYYIIL